MRTLRPRPAAAAGSATGPAPPSAYVGDLEQERDFFLRSLSDLERERAAGDMEEADFLALRDGYTARAAAVLRALEAARSSIGPAPASDGSPRRKPAVSPRRPRFLRPVIVATLVGAVAAVAGLLVATSAGDRLPGQTVSGGPSVGQTDKLDQARSLLSKGKTVEAIKKYDEVLRTDPRQPEALAYRGWLLRLAGVAASAPQLVDRGQQSVEAAIASDPSYADAHFFRGVILLEDRNQPVAAVTELRLFLTTNPPQALRSAVEEVLNRALAASGQPPVPTTTTTAPLSPPP
ncbi:MAG: tetratricopeptide repeat protein [Actinobacteria bacterium]|nr:MAG: tetratricopeptide repeat protein [Actinomycetota bacterium]